MATTTVATTNKGTRGSYPAHFPALGFGLLSVAVFCQPLVKLARLSLTDERSSHILLIPLVSLTLVFLQRERVFRSARVPSYVGVPLLLLGAALWSILGTSPLQESTDYLSEVAFCIVAVWIAGFTLLYGTRAARAAAFPLLFLLLTIPIPFQWADRMVTLLQIGSADICAVLFRLVGVPFVRHGLQFSLPGVDIEIAEQCSGIHSALALFIVGLLLQYLVLEGAWRKAVFVLCILPIALFKNALRIVTIAWLGVHVNPEFFHGQLHRQGGLPFAVLAVVMLGMLLWLLRSVPAARTARVGVPAESGPPLQSQGLSG